MSKSYKELRGKICTFIRHSVDQCWGVVWIERNPLLFLPFLTILLLKSIIFVYCYSLLGFCRMDANFQGMNHKKLNLYPLQFKSGYKIGESIKFCNGHGALQRFNSA